MVTLHVSNDLLVGGTLKDILAKILSQILAKILAEIMPRFLVLFQFFVRDIHRAGRRVFRKHFLTGSSFEAIRLTSDRVVG